MYVLLSLWGVIRYLDVSLYWAYYCFFVVALGGISCLLDLFRLEKLSCEKIYYIERRFLCLDYLFFYKSLFYKIILTNCLVYILIHIFNVEDKVIWGIIFACSFPVIYINIFPMYYVIMDSETLDAYMDEKKKVSGISIKSKRNKDVHCYLREDDLRNISAYCDSL